MPEPDNTMRGGFARWAPRTPIGTVIDVGASTGIWSRGALEFWPSARYHLIEARGHCHQTGLRQMASEYPNVTYALAAASSEVGTIYFHDSPDPYGGAAAHTAFWDHNMELPATTIDAEVARLSLPGPYLVKLDTHGFEVPILNGAQQTLQQASLLIIEVYNFTLREKCHRFWELCAWLEKRGFLCLDIVDLMRRNDETLWQCDMFFAPETRAEFGSNSYA